MYNETLGVVNKAVRRKMKLPARTHKSELTDGELILFDFLFNAAAPRSMIEEANFSFHNNTLYAHGFNTPELDMALMRLVNQGVLFSEQENHRSEQNQYLGLTALGGKLWESERKPIWERFIEESLEPSEQEGIWKVTIRSYSEEVLVVSSAYYVESRFLGSPISELEYTKSNSCSLVYWKKEDIVYECTYLARKEERREKMNWAEYEKNRTWWRGVGELQKHLA